MEIVAADIGGTHARFALATIEHGRVVNLESEAVLPTAQHAGLQSAWRAYGGQLGRPLPRRAGVALATPIQGDALKMTNSPWVIRVPALKSELGLDDITLVNDFAAIAHAVAVLDDAAFAHVCGPDHMPRQGPISIVGPGTGLGVAQLIRRANSYDVISTEGGHVGFAPSDGVEDQILALLRQRHSHVSAERIVSGPGLANIYAALAKIEQRTFEARDDKQLWTAALGGADPLATAALERFCLCFGACAGDIALAQGAVGVVLAGGISARLGDALTHSGFAQRFVAKGRFEAMMAAVPVRRVTHPEPGLFGAAAAFAWAHPS